MKLLDRLKLGQGKRAEQYQLLEQLNTADPVAERSSGLILKYGLYVVLGLYFFVAGGIVYIRETESVAVRAAMMAVICLGMFFIGLGILSIRSFTESPKIPIMTDGEYLFVFDRRWHSFLISEVTDVKPGLLGRLRGEGGDGTLIIYTATRKYRILNIRAVGATQTRLGY